VQISPKKALIRAWLSFAALAIACDAEPPTLESTTNAGGAGKSAGMAGRATGGSAATAGGAGGAGDAGAPAEGGTSGTAATGGGTGGGTGARAGSSTGGDSTGATGQGGSTASPGGSAGEGASPSTGGTGDVGGEAGNAGATSGPDPDSEAPTRLASVVAQCGAEGTEAVVESLARAGIETIDNVSGELLLEVTPPVRGLHVWLSQASAMACDLANGGGIRGQALDDMVGPIPLSDTESMAFSWFLAAYVTAEEGPFGQQLSRKLMSGAVIEDHATLVYPTLVIQLFMREFMLPALAEAAGLQAKRGTSTRPPPIAFASGDPCAAIGEFLDDLPSAVEGAIGKLAEGESGFMGFIVRAAAKAAGFAAYATAQGVRQFLQHLPGVDLLRAAGAASSAVADIRAMFTNWNITLISLPPTQHKPVGGTGSGQFILSVSAPEPGSDWPGPLRSCAELLNVSLPDFGTADGSSVKWIQVSGFNDPISEKNKEEVLASSQAKLNFDVVTEPATRHREGQCELKTRPSVTAQIGLPGLSQLGSTLAGFASPVAEGFIGAGADVAAELLGPSKSGNTEISYHPKEAKLDFVGGLEQIHVTSSTDGVGPDSAWSGTWASQQETTGLMCGPPDQKSVGWQFASGSASLSMSFMQSGGAMQYCSMTITETLTIEPDGNGCKLVTDGTYNSVIKPPDPGGAVPASGIRDEGYALTLIPDY